jgi:menaquinone-dependent protoporphyrinogen oxidase
MVDPLEQIYVFLESHTGESFPSPRGDFFRRGRTPSGFTIVAADREEGVVRLVAGGGATHEIARRDLSNAVLALDAGGIRIGEGTGSAAGGPSLEERLKAAQGCGALNAPLVADLLVLSGIAEFVWITAPSGRQVQGIKARRPPRPASGGISLISSVLATDIAEKGGVRDRRANRARDRVLITYATRHGSTAEVAGAIAQSLWKAGISADLLPMQDVVAVEHYRAVIVGSPLYRKKLLPEAVAFVAGHSGALAARPVAAFVTGSTLSDAKGRAVADRALDALRARVAITETGFFPGCLNPERLPLSERLMAMVAGIPAEDLRDWRQISAWAAGLTRICRAPA